MHSTTFLLSFVHLLAYFQYLTYKTSKFYNQKKVHKFTALTMFHKNCNKQKNLFLYFQKPQEKKRCNAVFFHQNIIYIHSYEKAVWMWNWASVQKASYKTKISTSDDGKKERLFAIIYSNLKLKHFMMLHHYKHTWDAIRFCGNWTSEISAAFNFSFPLLIMYINTVWIF